jgi:UPF0755 protein
VTVEPTIPVQPRKPVRWPLFLLGALVLIGGGFAYNTWRKREALRRYNWAKIVLPERLARVPAPWGVTVLSERLEKSGKTRDAETFREAAAKVGLRGAAAGAYLLPKTADPIELARAFMNGPTHEDVTFPEGFTAAQVAARLKKNGFAGGAQVASMSGPALEGRLFPDTYTLPIKGTAAELIAPMEDRWKEEMKKLPRPFPQVKGKALSEMEVVTLASLVEREAASRSEMPLIAGVMMARLRRPMRLQIDASVQYARLQAGLEHKSRLLFDDLEIDSKYNTYRTDGLPPGPICNPGAAALQAAARPRTTESLFYVYSPRSKRHVFAATFEQHKHNIAVARQERAALEKAATDAALAGSLE